MIEIETKHTHILTVDKETISEARKDKEVQVKLGSLIASQGFYESDATVRKDGLYYKFDIVG